LENTQENIMSKEEAITVGTKIYGKPWIDSDSDVIFETSCQEGCLMKKNGKWVIEWGDSTDNLE
jgi:hypothetical protein